MMEKTQQNQYDNAVLSGVEIDTALEHRVALYRLARLREQIARHQLNAVILLKPLISPIPSALENIKFNSHLTQPPTLVVPPTDQLSYFNYSPAHHLPK